MLKLPGEDTTMVGESFRDNDEADVVEIIGGGTTIYGGPKSRGVT